MLSQISTAAHELAVRGLRAGEGKIARSAATVGRMVDPVDEGHWRNAMRAEATLRHPAAVDQLMGVLRRTLDALGCGYQPEESKEQHWQAWMKAVDDGLEQRAGKRSDALAPWHYFEAYENGVTPEDAVEQALIAT